MQISKYYSWSLASVGGKKKHHAMSVNLVWLLIKVEVSKSAYSLLLLLLVVVVAVMDLGQRRCIESKGRMCRQLC